MLVVNTFMYIINARNMEHIKKEKLGKGNPFVFKVQY